MDDLVLPLVAKLAARPHPTWLAPLLAELPVDPGQVLAATLPLKAQARPQQHLDLVRAAALALLGRHDEARLALFEELDRFPASKPARELLTESSIPALPDELEDDDDFADIYYEAAPHSSLGVAELYALYRHVSKACQDSLPGDLIECGVGCGGSALLMAMTVRRFNYTDRKLHLFDSFAGLPAPFPQDGDELPSGWSQGCQALSVAGLRQLLESYKLNRFVELHPGELTELLPRVRNKLNRAAFLHIDTNRYAGTLAALNILLFNVIPAGIVQVSDGRQHPGTIQALIDFFADRDLELPLTPIGTTGLSFAKPIYRR